MGTTRETHKDIENRTVGKNRKKRELKMKDNNWDEKKQKKAKVIVDYMMDHLDKDDKLFSVFLCLRLVVQPTHVLEELRDRINANLITQQDIKEAKPATCRRVKRGATIAQSFSMGTVARTRMNRRSVRLSEEGTSENDNNNSRYSDHIKVVDAFDEILSELETVRVSMPKSETTTTSPTSTRIRPSSIKQRPYSTFVAKSNFDEEEERVRDSGYTSQRNSQSSVASSASASATDDEIFAESSIDVDQMIFSLIDYWSLHFTGDLQYHDTLHLVMEILEKLRQRNKISLEQSASILLRVNRHLALTCNLSKPIRCKFTKRALKTKPFVVHYPAVKIAHRLTHIEMNLLQSTSVEHFIAKRSRNALDAWADWFNLLSHLTASQVCLASNTTKAAKVIDHLIQVAMECCASGNWNSAMAIALGLNLTPVARLTKTWSKVKSEKLFVLKVSVWRPQ